MKNIGIVGATGSIGVQATEIIHKYPDAFNVKFLSCHNNINELLSQISILKPEYAVVTGEKAVSGGVTDTKILYGMNALTTLISEISGELDLVLSSAVGFAGIMPTYTALKNGVNVALANKESIVAAGKTMIQTAEKTNTSIMPVDSEHSAIYQCLKGHGNNFIDKVVLTASGGPFRYRPSDSMDYVDIGETLKHPNWNMGNKITVDSATMMNKGLELIEAHYLFDISPDKLDVFIHPQSIFHSIVSFIDGSNLAQIGLPDMKAPISYALGFPDRLNWGAERLTPQILNGLTFFKPDKKKYPCFAIALDVLKEGKNSLMITMNAANEVAVDTFLRGLIKFTDIHRVIGNTLELFESRDISSIDEIISLDNVVREKAKKISQNIGR
ncbi:MAG: 1-deoxy-D-xylulose-5-phosphate reductoisomerase [Flexistipes sinusarabici]|uniref:1-deoxy-D-xylulose 5-phosphate reductoisomerase n=1 Tax=Flexistipes sinusarabici TaxID=2352 RepID=A0A5D0MTD9_FLESI|nr:1-deoxy-D-xylulose-5-phosphate reductoisomerase [Flexistipes sinusarabici]TYB35374.1 MAG: 1-deoxy-D-xylulose-5-phosphate reductoisomerase [Flexistipes sinusarabici]